MKIVKILILCTALLGSSTVQAQSLGGLLKTIAGENTQKVVTGILGKVGVTTNSIEGTWSYTSPCLVFNSENLLASLGSNLVSSKVNSYLGSALVKAGIKPGSMTIKFATDGTCVITVAGRSVNATYTMTGSTLSLTFPATRKTVAMNVNLNGNELQFAMKADKLLALVQNVSTQAGNISGTLGTVGTLLKSYDGMQVGLKFARK